MKVIATVKEIQKDANELRIGGHTLALVPTMGFLHEGHLALMRIAKDHADRLIVSIFVNPTQFGPSEDFSTYPRDTEGDLEKVRSVGADLVFMPSAEEMYPDGWQTRVSVGKLTRHLCGLTRPGHFDGVATVVAKLFNCTMPHVAVFGQKDYQQLAVIRRMALDLNMDIEIIGAPTVREPDGLAMSSRNTYLSPEERVSALCLKKSLDLARKMFREGMNDASVIQRAVEALIKDHPFTSIDYVSLCDPESLEELKTIRQTGLLALAVRVGKTRLIDNCLIRK